MPDAISSASGPAPHMAIAVNPMMQVIKAAIIPLAMSFTSKFMGCFFQCCEAA